MLIGHFLLPLLHIQSIQCNQLYHALLFSGEKKLLISHELIITYY